VAEETLMKKVVRPLGIVAILAMALAGVGYAKPSLATDLGLDFWNAPELQARIERNLRLHDELEQKDVEVLRRIDAKETIVADLVAGRATLAEAATHFKILNAARPDYQTIIRAVYPGATDDERICRNVIAFVEAHVTAGNRAGRGIVERLNAELQRRIARGEPLTLPDLLTAESERPPADRQ
jgi:hypothetical protein